MRGEAEGAVEFPLLSSIIRFLNAMKDFDTFDFTALPGLSKPTVLELGRCE